MLTLIKAFRLCQICNEPVFIRSVDGNIFAERYFWSEKVREQFDMKKVRVVRIEPLFSRYEYNSYRGMLFVVRGITDKELAKIEQKDYKVKK